MTRLLQRAATAALGVAVLGLVTGPAQAKPARPNEQFERVATFLVCENTSCDRSQVPLTSAEIVAASEDGRTLVYTDSPNRALGFVDIHTPADPKPLGALALDGEPTSVAVAGRWALVAVNTSTSFVNPSGYLGVFDLAACAANVPACQPRRRIALAGQPDSVAISPDRLFAAIVVENQRDEDVIVDGVEGGLPQAPAGVLQVLRLQGPPARWELRTVFLSGLSSASSTIRSTRESSAGGFVGLSELTTLDDDTLLVLERDNQGGPDAWIKRLYTVSVAGVTPAPQGDPFPLLAKTLVRDLLPDLAAPRGWLQEKVEGVAVAIDGQVYIVTDNDGVDDNTGETQFIRLGHRSELGF